MAKIKDDNSSSIYSFKVVKKRQPWTQGVILIKKGGQFID